MIIVKLVGGLGNQLFQYAAGKALAVRNNTELMLDITSFNLTFERNFDLRNFSINASIASELMIKKLNADTSIKRIRERLRPYSAKRFYKERFFHYDVNFFKLKAPLYLKGYFQSEKYFKPVEGIIRKEFSPTLLFANELRHLAGSLQNQNSVSIHLRMGDYTNLTGNSYHGILPSSYYQEAVLWIKNKIENPVFYLFSDNPETAKEILRLPQANVVSGVFTKNHFEDFYLMSSCRHQIIANSSFSWWSAWLNNYPGKIVVAPGNWFNGGPKDTQDLVPESWIKL